jgi:hypothetical protein
VLAVTGLLAVALATAEAGEPKLIIDVEEPFLLQGQVCPAGTVSIRFVSRYNPTSTLHEVRVGGEPLGVFRAAHVVGEDRDAGDTVRFERNRQGTLVLLGYTLRRGGSTEAFRFAVSPGTPPGVIALAEPPGTRRSGQELRRSE